MNSGCCFPFTSDTFQIGKERGGDEKIDVYHHRMNKIYLTERGRRRRRITTGKL